MDKRLLKVLKHDYAVEMDKKRNLKAIRTLYDMNEKEEYHIDEQTWNDLDLDKVYSKLDRNYSSLGEASLYSMLRNPLNDEKKLNKRREEIEYFKENEEVRFKIMWIFFELGRDKKNSLLDMINEKLIESNKFKYYFYTITGKILPLILILTAIFVSVSAMLGLMAVTFVNIYINSKERDRIKANGLMYLRRVIKASKQVVRINDNNLEDFNIITKKNNLFTYVTTNWGIVSTVELPENHVYKVLNKTLPKDKQVRLEVVKDLDEAFKKYKGEILKGVCVEKEFKDKLKEAKEELIACTTDLEVVSSWDDNFEIMKKGSSKGEAVQMLAKYLGVSQEEVMCIGDSENDLSMITWAGTGVAMGNAIDSVKDVANYVTADNKHGGVAEAIRKFVL